MILAKSLLVRGITLSLALVCLAVSTPIHGFDVRFTSGTRALDIPFELVNNHIYLKASVNGSAPLSFILDTGARAHLSACKMPSRSA
jgi:hypothetical protein